MFLWAALLAAASAFAATVSPGPGISEALANGRAATISELRYELRFTIPEKKTEAILGSETIRFQLRAPHTIILDFDQPPDHVRELRVNGRPAEYVFADGHLVVPASASKAGANEVAIE